MKSTFLFVLFAVSVYADTSKWQEFRVKYGLYPNSNTYVEIKKTLAEAERAGWTRANTTNRLGATTLCYSAKDNRLCPIYDKNGFIAGMLLAIPVEDVENHGIPYDFNNFPVYEKKTVNDKLYWTSTYYLNNPTTVTAGRTSTPTLGDGLWFQETNGFREIPTDLATIERTTLYTKQNCIPQMGRHYYYNMSSEMSCEKFEPFFLLVRTGNIVGLGWQFFGKTTPVDINWYDNIGELAVRATLPRRPSCVVENTKKYGVISIHMYFVKCPWFILCFPWDSVDNFWFLH